MRSLRSRLILGSALIAVVPLTVAMVLLSRRVETMVRTEATERLDSTLGSLATRLASDRTRIAERLAILAAEPQLKRLYLVRPAGSRDLADYLRDRRVLLGLDVLRVVDTSGTVVAEDLTSGATASTEARAYPEAAATAAIRYEGANVGELRGGLVLDREFLERLRAAGGLELVLRDASHDTVAATAGAAATASRSHRSRSVTLDLGGAGSRPATLTGLVSTAAADRAIAVLQWTSALLGGLGLVIAVLLGALWSSQVSRPVERLAAFSQRVAQGEWDQPLELRSVRELETLVEALDRMRGDLRAYRDRLVTGERQAAWGQMARKVAHEIKNPLTPIAISVADLRRSYQLGRPDFPQILDQAARTVADEVETLKRLLQEFSDFGRMPAPRIAPVRLSALFADLETLYGREVAAGRLVLARDDPEFTFPADAGQLRQALVNLIKNGLESSAEARVTVTAAANGAGLELTVADTGPGLAAEQRSQLFVPGFTTKAHGSGLGLTIVERIVHDHRGTIAVDSRPGGGTTFRIRLPQEQRS